MKRLTLDEDLTISIISHGHREHLVKLLEDLNNLTLVRMKVIVTLNIPETEPEASDYPGLKLVLIHNDRPKGFGANHNEAFLHCTSDWFVVLNPDLRVEVDPFTPMLRAAHQHRRVGIISPTVLNPSGTVEDHVRRNLTPASLWRRLVGVDDTPHTFAVADQGVPFYWIAGMFLMFSAPAFRDVRGFDERFFLYCEDYDICARVYDAGYSLVVNPNAHVVHAAQRDSHRSLKHLRWHLASFFKVWTSRAFWRVTLRQRSFS
jgi:N-acetylglucosaminyl-diphospho-decaprenol L-rhamnosyltransferase